MSTSMTAYDAICNNCLSHFNINQIFSSAVNLDNMPRERELFEKGLLNVITCSKCGKSFVYEIPMVLYSEELKVVYYVEPKLTAKGDELRLRTPFAFMGSGYKYRAVNYQNQAREKYLIELAGLNDIFIEYIKLVSFSDDVALPFDTNSLEFVSRKGDTYCFKQYDCLGDEIDSFEIEFPETLIPKNLYDIDLCGDKWQKIDRLTIPKYKEEL